MDETTALTLPDEQTFRRDIAAINRFQDIVHANMKSGQDYGVIPGTKKPTLLKPGAEKIAKLLGLADLYEIVDRQENWQTGFFRYLVKCKLVSVRNDITISEGLGECNSLESKYRWRWVFPDDVPENIDKQKILKRTGKRRDGKGTYTQYRLENEDIYSQVNTILKMAKKRALVDAALSAGRLSEVFTQDVEDLPDLGDAPSDKAEAVKVSKPPTKATTPKPIEDEVNAEQVGVELQPQTGAIDMDWLMVSIKELHWSEATFKTWVRAQAVAQKWDAIDISGTLTEFVGKLNAEQREFICKEIQSRLDLR